MEWRRHGVLVWKNGREKKDGSGVARKIYSTYIVCTFDWRDGTVDYPLHEMHIKLAPPAVWPAACYLYLISRYMRLEGRCVGNARRGLELDGAASWGPCLLGEGRWGRRAWRAGRWDRLNKGR